MKLNANVLLVVAMMAGSLSAMGCKNKDTTADQSTDTATPDESPTTAPVSTEAAAAPAAPGVEKDARAFAYYAPHGPPALRVEERGALRPGHFWAPGYYGWNGHDHVWHGGGWYPERAGYSYYGPRWEQRGGRWGYAPGRWNRR